MKKAGSGFRLFHFLYGILLLFLLFIPVYSSQAQSKADQPKLFVPGASIESEISVGQTQNYEFTLLASHYAEFTIEPHDVELEASIIDSEGNILSKFAGKNIWVGDWRVIKFSFVSQQSMKYVLRVSASSNNNTARPLCRYKLRVSEFRPANESDRSRAQGEKLWAAAYSLLSDPSSDAKSKALLNLDAARTIFRQSGNQYAEALTLCLLGNYWYQSNDSSKALEMYELAKDLWQKLGSSREEGITISEIGLLAYVKSNYIQALAQYEQSLKKSKLVDDKFYEGTTLQRIGWVQRAQGTNRLALESFHQAFELMRSLGRRESQAAVLNDIGRAYLELGEIQQARISLQKALELAPPQQNPFNAASILNRLGILYRSTSEWQKAIEVYQQALALNPDKRTQAGLFNNIGLVLTYLNDRQQALEYYEKGLALCRETGLRNGEGVILQGIGTLLVAAGDYNKGYDYYQQSLTIRRATRDLAGEAQTLGFIGSYYNIVGDPTKSLEASFQAVEKYRALNGNKDEAGVLTQIGVAYGKKKEDKQALDYFEQALIFSRKMENHFAEARTLFERGRFYFLRQQLHQAQEDLAGAIQILQLLRGRISSQELRISSQSSIHNYYNLYIETLVAAHMQQPTKGFDAQALFVAESVRALGLLEQLQDAAIEIRQGVDRQLLLDEVEVRQKLNIKAARQSGILSSKHTDQQAAEAAQEVNELTRQLRDITAKLRSTNPHYTALTQPKSVKLEEIQQSILDEGTVLLEYILSEEQSWLFAVTKSGLQTFKLPAEKEINDAARKFYEALTARESATDFAGIEQQINTSGADLSKLILAPISKQLSNEWKGKRLAIVASGALEYVPFSALPNVGNSGQGTGSSKNLTAPLITDHEIVNLPSASVLGVIRQEIAARKSAPKQVAVLADPVFEKNDPRLAQAKNKAPSENENKEIASNANLSLKRSMRDFGSELGRLTFSRQEADAIASMTKAGQGLQRVSFAANRANAMSEELGQYRIIHFATHGLLNSEHPELSGLVFSLIDEQGKPQDGFLRLHDIYNLKLPADLVVLSACQTALGKEVKGEGLIGLTRGFMYAGAPRVVASLWRVNDYATAELMKRFYAGMLKENLPAAAALRAAQLGMMKQKRFSSPYYWAAFTLQGEWK